MAFLIVVPTGNFYLDENKMLRRRRPFERSPEKHFWS